MFLAQIPSELILFSMLYGGAAVASVIACVYLCLRKGNAFAADVTPPVSLRRWAAAFFAVAFLGHVWWYLFFIFSGDIYSVSCLVVAVIDSVSLFITITGTLLAMLQDRKRSVWPIVPAMIPYVALLVLNIGYPNGHYIIIAIAYILLLYVIFSIYMVFAVRQYGRWLRDNYADVEHKEVWLSHIFVIVILLFIIIYGFDTGDITIAYLVQFINFILFCLLLWRVETLPQLDLTITQLAQAVGTNRLYLSHYFSRQGMTYNAYINDLRIDHFMSLYREATSARQPITAQQLASDSGYRSYSTFSLAFKQRLGKSVTAWMREMAQ